MHVSSPSNHGLKAARERIRQFSILASGVLIGFFASSMLFFHTSSHVLEDKGGSCNRSKNFPIPVIRSKEKELLGNHDQSGWKDIHIFFGNTAHLKDATSLPTPYFQANRWFSQFRQDEIVSRLLYAKRGGYFIDLAANDPIRISNTYALETHYDWNGLCVEPNPVYWSGLSYRKCVVVGAVIGSRQMEEISFRFPKEKAPKGGILGDKFDNKADRYGEGNYRYTVTLLEIFDRFQVPPVIDYISLDIEGAEDLVMASFPFSKYRFNLMTVERPSAELSHMLESEGYILLKTIKRAIETLWVHHSLLGKIDMAALDIDSQNYKYRDSGGQLRIAPEDFKESQVTTPATMD